MTCLQFVCVADANALAALADHEKTCRYPERAPCIVIERKDTDPKRVSTYSWPEKREVKIYN